MHPLIMEIARAAEAEGGRAVVVGGYVRDRLLGLESKDVDVEVLGFDEARLAALLSRFGRVIPMGRSFAVMRLAGLDVDFCVPRLQGAGDPAMHDFAFSARRRDLTINSIGFDPLTEEILDPHGGRADLEAGILRATDPARFGDDPLRALRVAAFVARFEMRVDPALKALCGAQDLSQVAGERIFEEMRKLLLKSARPSRGFDFLSESGSLRFFREIEALRGVAQDPHWHPEGDVFVHTLLVVDEAARLRRGDDEDLCLMFAALCHDLGKPSTTALVEGRVKSHGHDRAGVAPTTALLERMLAPRQLVLRVCALVEHHLAPSLFVKNRAGPKGYHRLARRLRDAGVSLELLARVARADHLGRTTEDALARTFPAGDEFLERAEKLSVRAEPRPDVVLGRHLIARGLQPGPEFATLLARCREIQDEAGERDPQRILDQVLGT